MAAAPVIVDRKPVAVLYGALRTTDPIGGRTLDVLAMEARAVEQEIVTARVRLEARSESGGVDGDRLAQAYARLRLFVAHSDDAGLAAELDRLTAEFTSDATSSVDLPALTGREHDVLALAALGHSNARIADQLGITVHTTKGYLKSAMRKLGATTRLEAVITARRSGLMP